MTTTGNGKKPTHTDRARALADALENTEWDEKSSPDVHIHVSTTETGKHRALADQQVPDSEPTVPDHDKPSSTAPVMAKNIMAILASVKTWPQVVALGFLLVFLYFAGKAAGWF